jgi:hypothetical protein
VKVQRAAIVLHLADGACTDPNGIADDIPASHGWRQLKKRITILTATDLDAAWPFVEAAYRTRPHRGENSESGKDDRGELDTETRN